MIRTWIQRTWGRLRGQAPSEQERRVAAVLDGGAIDGGTSDADDRSLLAALHEALPAGTPIEPATRELLLVGLRRRMERADETGLALHLAFWAQLCDRFTADAELRLTRGYVCYFAGQDDLAMRCFLAAYEIAPTLIARDDDRGDLVGGDLLDEAAFASERPRELHLAWELALLRGLLAAERDDARELYSELLEQWRDDGDATARLRELGSKLAALEDEGRLPRAIVRRTRPRPPRRPGESAE